MDDHLAAVGSVAPDFKLRDQNGELVHLRKLVTTHPVVLFFYPGDQTLGCVIQLCAVRDDVKTFEEGGVRVFGINHGNRLSHAAFAAKHGLTFPLLVDTQKKVSRRYAATKQLSKATIIARTVIGIDRHGIIRYRKQGLPRNSDILKVLTTYR